MLTFITESCFYSQVWHLVRHDSDSQKDSERSNKLVSEIYLTRYASPTVALALAFLRLTDLVWVDRRRRGSECCNELSVANSLRLGVAALHSLAACSLSMTVDFFKFNGELEIKRSRRDGAAANQLPVNWLPQPLSGQFKVTVYTPKQLEPFIIFGF